MPESVLWSLDARGHLLRLSTHAVQWRRHWSPRSKIGHFSRMAAGSWCVWAIASDQQCYLMVLSSDLKIRVAEELYENERAGIFGGFSGKRLAPGDPPNFCRLADGRVARKETTRLPSSRWSWEDGWYVQETSNGALTEKGGWQYANDFSGPFISERRMLTVVRRRKWVRFRRFTAVDRWLYIHSPHADHTTDPFVNIAVGGEMLPHRPDGALLVYGITMEGVVYFRQGVERACPEGTAWKRLELTRADEAIINCSVGPMGTLWLVCDDGTVLVRRGVTWQNVYGTAWVRLQPPDHLLPHQMLVQAVVGTRSAWAVANTGHCWFRKGVDVFLAEDTSLPDERRQHHLLGGLWVEMTGRVLMLSIAPNDQVWGLDMVSRELLYRTGIGPGAASGKVWRKLVLNLEPKRQHRRRRALSNRVRQDSSGESCYSPDVDDVTESMRRRRNSLPAVPMVIRGDLGKAEDDTDVKDESFVNIDVGEDAVEMVDEVVVEVDGRLSDDAMDDLDERDDEDGEWKSIGADSDTDAVSSETSNRLPQTALRWCCASALELSQSDLPRLWKLAASKVADGGGLEGDTDIEPVEHVWRSTVLTRLKSRNQATDSAAFQEFPSVIERGTWVKEAAVQLQQKSSGAWLPGRLILEQWRDGSEVSGVLKMQVLPQDGRRTVPDADLNLSALVSVRSITCVAKLMDPSGRAVIGVFLDAMAAPHPVQLASEEEAEDWLSTITLVCCEHRLLLLHPPAPTRLFITTALGEVFLNEEAPDTKATPLAQRYWRQVGGHFRMVESGAHGVTWAIGYDKRPWVYTGGFGGGFFQGLVTSVAGINPQVDSRKVYTYEFQRWRFLSGYTDRSSWLGPHMWSDETGKEPRPKDSFRLLSRSWKWCTDWFVEHSMQGACDVEGWQYANSFTGPYERTNRWNTAFRRRKWMRTYRVATSGPWEEVLSVKLLDVAVQPAPCDEGVVNVWAIAASGEVLLRVGVSRESPKGVSWEHVEAELGFRSISVSPYLHVWAVDVHGTAWIRTGVTPELPRGLSWLLVGAAPDGVPLRHVSAGGMFRLYACDAQDRLWRRIGASLSNAEGVQWVLVSNGVSEVSCGPDGTMLAVMRKSGSIAERKGIAVDAPGGRCWSPVLKGLCDYVSVRGASCL